MDIHINNANNFQVITSYEFAHITTYLTSSEISPASVLDIMKTFKSIKCNEKKHYYTVDQQEAWEYFNRNYGSIIVSRRIRDKDDLLQKAQDYIERYNMK